MPEEDVAPDGSPVAVYLRLPPGATPALIDGAIRRHAHILELGCGVGRITHALVGLGHMVVAVDNSGEMLRHVRGARTVLADIETLRLDERFDAVVLASHFINAADPSDRQSLLDVCKRHARPDGVVLIERYDPSWARAVEDQTREVAGVTISMHDITRDVTPEGDLLHASVTYELDGQVWTQRFTAAVLDDDAFVAEAERAGLTFDAWLDPEGCWARLRA